VHHGGIGTAMRALRAGVPQVIMAHGMDRPDNAARLAKLELAQWTQSKDWTVPGVCAQLRDAVADTGYRVRARTILMDDDAGTAVTTVVEALESLRKCSG
jgi:UDP:flavonoid glycosyltransferase YjiC (YdhE family)